MAQHYYSPNTEPAVSWVNAQSGWVPNAAAVHGGFDINGETLYVGRSLHESGDVIPGKVVPSHGVVYVAFGGRENPSRDFQVLHARPGCELVWIPTAGNAVPTGAVQGGATVEGEALFIGRHEHEGSFVIGKVQPSHGSLYVGFGGREVPFRDFEVLCIKHLPL